MDDYYNTCGADDVPLIEKDEVYWARMNPNY